MRMPERMLPISMFSSVTSRARGDDGDLHKAIGVVLLVAQGDADVLMEIAGYIVGLGFLHEAVHAEQQLVELVGLILGIIADVKRV